MKYMKAFLCLAMALFCVIQIQFIHADDNLERLEIEFQTPPMPARPWAYWCWINGNFNYARITRELEEIARKGMGGFNLFDIGAYGQGEKVPAGPAFMGPESLDAIGFAVREAGRLGLGIGLIVSNSWDAGGSWIPPELGTMGLFASSSKVTGTKHLALALPFPEVKISPKNIKYKDLMRPDGLPRFYRDVAVLAIPAGDKSETIPLNRIIDLTDRLDRGGNLTGSLPEGEWEIVRYVCTNTGETLKLPSPNSDGLILDHFNPKATTFHFNYILDRLESEIGDLSHSALKYLYLCSYEIRGMIWTPALAAEFQQRRGYNMTPYLPALFERTVENRETTERFLFDYKKTLSDLIIEGHYRNAREMAHKRGLQICSEAGGPGQPLHNCPVEALRALGTLDIPRGEFWNKHQVLNEEGIDLLWLVKEIACASHIYGKTLVQGEAFTSFEHWQEGPFELKPLADRAMCEGLNHFVFHTFAHNPPEAGEPGWVYHAGTHIGPNRVWWPMAGDFIDYLSRCSYLLQRGLFVADVCYYYGDRAPNFVDPKHIDPSLGYGFDYDVVNSEVILNRMGVMNGRIVLPDGMNYALLVLPEEDAMDLVVLKKLERLISEGATVVGAKPVRSYGLHDAQRMDEEVRTLADAIWGKCDGSTVLENPYGKGKVVWGKTLRDILAEKGIAPDFQVNRGKDRDAIDYIHRRDGDCDIYFVINRTGRPIDMQCAFRVEGKVPEFWQPDTGLISRQYYYRKGDSHTWVPMQMPSYGSVFVVFRDSSPEPYIRSVIRDSSAEEESLLVTQNQQSEFTSVIGAPGHYKIIDSHNRVREIEVDAIPEAIALDGPWDVRFPHEYGIPPVITFPEPISWTNHELEAIRYFSGIANYRKAFELPSERIGDSYRFFLNLGKVKEVAEVFLNDRRVGIVWKEPFELDITDPVRAGENHLAIDVANVWNNRLVGDAKLPPEWRRTHTNIAKGPKAWGTPWKDVPLIEAGLIGPVKIEVRKRIVLK